jgi:hemerythrin superfamily protein
MDALQLLSQQHDEATELLLRLIDTNDAGERGRLRDDVVRVLAAHMAVEEELLYPRLEGIDDQLGALVDSAFRDHDEVRDVLGELARIVGAHVGTEEERMFPAAKDALGDTLAALGDDLARRHAEVVAGPPRLAELSSEV